MKATIIVQKESKKFGYVLSNPKVKTKDEMVNLLREIFKDYEIIKVKIK